MMASSRRISTHKFPSPRQSGEKVRVRGLDFLSWEKRHFTPSLSPTPRRRGRKSCTVRIGLFANSMVLSEFEFLRNHEQQLAFLGGHLLVADERFLQGVIDLPAGRCLGKSSRNS